MPDTNNASSDLSEDRRENTRLDSLKARQEKQVEDDLELQSIQDDKGDLAGNEPNQDLTEEQENMDDNDKLKIADESVAIAKSKAVLIKKLLINIKENNDRLIQLTSGLINSEDEENISIGQMGDGEFQPSEAETTEGRIIEGVFDGENMIGPDGKQYSVPANYASKSKLVEGDILKLTITAKGTFVYKQIGPIERSRVVGKLEKNSDGNFIAAADNKKWRILTASVTYFKGESGDEIVILIPKTGESKWAAVENIVRDTNNLS